MKHVYGPISSWRLGRSLGVDLISKKSKICSFNCIYCQLEKTDKITADREVFVDIDSVRKDLKNALKKTNQDVITLSGMGEPTLALNMDDAIKMIRDLTNIPIAILTNSTLLYDKKIQKALSKIDIIVAKLDAPSPRLFKIISRPASGVTFEQTIRGIKEMHKCFNGKFALQIMFMDENKAYAKEIADLAREIAPDEVQINTPLRPCNTKPLSKKELLDIEKEFSGLNTINVYTSDKPKTDPLDKMELIKRRRTDI